MKLPQKHRHLDSRWHLESRCRNLDGISHGHDLGEERTWYHIRARRPSVCCRRQPKSSRSSVCCRSDKKCQKSHLPKNVILSYSKEFDITFCKISWKSEEISSKSARKTMKITQKARNVRSSKALIGYISDCRGKHENRFPHRGPDRARWLKTQGEGRGRKRTRLSPRRTAAISNFADFFTIFFAKVSGFSRINFL